MQPVWLYPQETKGQIWTSRYPILEVEMESAAEEKVQEDGRAQL